VALLDWGRDEAEEAAGQPSAVDAEAEAADGGDEGAAGPGLAEDSEGWEGAFRLPLPLPTFLRDGLSLEPVQGDSQPPTRNPTASPARHAVFAALPRAVAGSGSSGSDSEAFCGPSFASSSSSESELSAGGYWRRVHEARLQAPCEACGQCWCLGGCCDSGADMDPAAVPPGELFPRAALRSLAVRPDLLPSWKAATARCYERLPAAQHPVWVFGGAYHDFMAAEAGTVRHSSPPSLHIHYLSILSPSMPPARLPQQPRLQRAAARLPPLGGQAAADTCPRFPARPALRRPPAGPPRGGG
jgi:hypothetical protein